MMLCHTSAFLKFHVGSVCKSGTRMETESTIVYLRFFREYHLIKEKIKGK